MPDNSLLSSNALRILLGSVSAAAFVGVVNGGLGNFLPTFQQSLLGVGGPTALAMVAVQAVKGENRLDTADALLIGVAGVGIIMVMGALPVELDLGTIALGGMIAAGAWTGDYLTGV